MELACLIGVEGEISSITSGIKQNVNTNTKLSVSCFRDKILSIDLCMRNAKSQLLQRFIDSF